MTDEDLRLGLLEKTVDQLADDFSEVKQSIKTLESVLVKDSGEHPSLFGRVRKIEERNRIIANWVKGTIVTLGANMAFLWHALTGK